MIYMEVEALGNHFTESFQKTTSRHFPTLDASTALVPHDPGSGSETSNGGAERHRRGLLMGGEQGGQQMEGR